MTEKLYYKDAFLKEFEAIVLSCSEKDGHYEILLDKTAFFPEGGGQAGDTGYIGNAEIYDTKEHDGEIRHLSNAAVNCGETVCCRLDFESGLNVCSATAASISFPAFFIGFTA